MECPFRKNETGTCHFTKEPCDRERLKEFLSCSLFQKQHPSSMEELFQKVKRSILKRLPKVDLFSEVKDISDEYILERIDRSESVFDNVREILDSLVNPIVFTIRERKPIDPKAVLRSQNVTANIIERLYEEREVKVIEKFPNKNSLKVLIDNEPFIVQCKKDVSFVLTELKKKRKPGKFFQESVIFL